MHRLYLDEVGTDDLTHLVEDRHRYLSLTGVILTLEDARDQLRPRLDAIKATIFDRDPDDVFCFHRKDVLGFKGRYEVLRDAGVRARYEAAMLATFSEVPYTVITTIIDKDWMVRQRHWTKAHPYHYLMEIIVEKYVQFLERNNSFGDIMPESRQSKIDRSLQRAFDIVRANGNWFVAAERISRRIRSANLKFRTKRDCISGLELCDLLAHPSHIHARSLSRHDVNLGPFSTRVVQILTEAKYDRSQRGRILGYGIKALP